MTAFVLMGSYLQANGLEGAMKLMAWFRLLPNDSINLILSDIQAGDHTHYANVDQHLQCASSLEEKMQYTFRNRSYLLDALTHDSYIDADNQGQDRLSTIGYSILGESHQHSWANAQKMQPNLTLPHVFTLY